MKKYVLLAVIFGCFLNEKINAQACAGGSGPSVCTPEGGLTVAGFYPDDTALPCAEDGIAYDQVINFVVPDSVDGFKLNFMQINLVNNLPCGLCWASNSTTNTITAGTTGCIRVTGTTFDAQGEYDIKVYATANVELFGSGVNVGPLNIDSALGLRYYARVTLAGDTCALIDTNSVGLTASTSGSIVEPTITGTKSICNGSSTTLTATGASYYGYAWSNNTYSSSITVSAAGTYTVTVYDNCNSATASVNVTSASTAAKITASGDTTFCQGGSVNLTATAGTSYLWTGGATTRAITVSTNGTYTVIVTNANGCPDTSSPVTVTVNSLPTATITPGGPTTFCQGGSVILTASAGTSYSWTGGATTNAITVTTGNSYVVTVTNINGCSAASTATVVTVNPLPTATITPGGPTTFCSGGSVTLTASAGTSYQWTGGATTSAITATTGGNYVVTVTNANNCSAASSPAAVTVNPLPSTTITPSGATTFCQGGSVTLSAPAGLSYVWSTAATTQSINVNASGDYSVDVTNTTTNCSASSLIDTVTVNPNPTATITPGGQTTFCTGDSVSLSGPDGLGYLWNNSATSQTIYASQNGAYSLTVTDLTTNCTASTATNITVNPATVITASPIDQGTCLGGTVNFSVSATGTALTYQWLVNGVATGNTSTEYTVASAQLSDTGTYVAVVTGTCGIDTSAAGELSVTQSITISQQPVSQSVCQGSPVSFSVIANGNGPMFQWLLDGQSLPGDTNSVLTIDSASISDTGSYTCQISSGCGDTLSEAAYLTVLLPSQASVFDTICNGASVDFNGQTANSTGTYTANLTNDVGCDSIVTLYLTVNPTYNTYDSATICAGDSFNLNGQFISAANVYYDTLQSVSGCDSVIIFTLSLIQPSYTNLSQNICLGDTFNFNGTTLSAAGSYPDTLQGTNSCDSIVILTLSVINPVYDTVTQAICSGDSFGFNGVSYTSSGYYNDTLSGTNTCDSIVTLNLTVNPPAYDTMQQAICSGDTFNFNGAELTLSGYYNDTLAGANTCDSIVTLNLTVIQPALTDTSVVVCGLGSYSFNGKSYTTSGTYADTLSGSNTCDSIVVLSLTFDTLTALSWNVPDDTLCDNNSATVFTIAFASPTGGIYSGAGVSDTSLTAALAGPYTVTYIYTDTLGCTDSISQLFVVDSCITAISEVSLENAIRLYPNPVSESLIIESDLFTVNSTLPVLYNVSGQMIPASFTRQANKLICNTKALAVGMYSLKFTVEGTVVSKRFVKVN